MSGWLDAWVTNQVAEFRVLSNRLLLLYSGNIFPFDVDSRLVHKLVILKTLPYRKLVTHAYYLQSLCGGTLYRFQLHYHSVINPMQLV